MSLLGPTKPMPPSRKKLRRTLVLAALAAGSLLWGARAVQGAGLLDRWVRDAVVGQLEKMSGGRVELQGFHFDPFRWRVELSGLTIRGLEPQGTLPYFHADKVLLDIRVDSLFHRKISLDEVQIDRPVVHVRVEANGSTNAPAPKGPPGRPLRERVFDVAIRRLRLNDGYILFNDVRTPLVAEGGQFNFALDFNVPAAGKEFYLGQVSWQRMTVATRRYLPFPSDVSLKFTLERGAFRLEQAHWKLPRSEFDAQATLENFAKPAWNFRYRGRLNLDDVRRILRKPNTPGGVVEFSGEGSDASGRLSVRGRYTAHDVTMRYAWFHSAGMESRGSYRADSRMLEVPDFEARALGGRVQGRLDVALRGLQFRANTHARGLSLADILAAANNPTFPLVPLHWNASVDADSVTTWESDFKHVESRGLSLWAPTERREREIPVSGRISYRYVMDRRAVELQPSEISTPGSHLEFRGVLGTRDSALEAKAEVQDLLPWDDFINRLRGKNAEPLQIGGRARWEGRLSGPLKGPTFAGRFQAYQARYGDLYWDGVEGEVTYSPDELRLVRAQALRGRSSAQFELWLGLNNWSFAPESRWTLEANLVRAETDDLQELFGRSYPARGLLAGQFHGRGTRGDPELTGLFDLAEVEAWGYRFDRFRGQLNLRRDEIRIVNAELRTLPAPQASRVPGVVTGNFLYQLTDQQIAFDLTGAVISLEGIERIQTNRLPLGGQLSFHVSGQGALRAPVSQGTLRVVDLRVGKEVLGSFEGKLNSDGRRVHLDLNSAMSTGRLEGRLDLALGGEYPLEGQAVIERLDLDPFLQAAFHLTDLTGHSSVDGRFQIYGVLARPETLVVQTDISRVVFDYANVKLENSGPVRVTYRRDEVRIEQANLRGTDTDFRISGFARFAGDRRISMNVAGTLNLRLAEGFLPRLEARGLAQVNAAIEGTTVSPRITGKAHVENAAAHYGDFPAGLGQVTADFVFDSSRLLFENVTAETGGGQLLLSGSVTYGEGPLRYDISARSARVRIRYPEGMSWLAGGTLRLSGTRQAGLLSGRVVVERLLMAQGFDLASLIIASKEPVRAPSTTSPFLRNLQFDIEGVSSPDARVEWTGARFDSEASLRIRGTWEHPILLGHVHLLSGEMTFRGNRYLLTRGDINFSNPFRLDPVLSVEATTTIRQYEVTLNFTGPASKLTLAYRSDPPLPASDIVTLLALGRTGEESELRSSAAVQAPGASALLSEAISSQLGGRLERLFGISRFRVDPFLAGTGTESNSAARITIEQQVARDLVITYSTNVTSTQQQVIQVEYNVGRNVSIVALRDQNGTFGLDVKFKKRFK